MRVTVLPMSLEPFRGVHVWRAGLCQDVRVRYHVLPPEHQKHLQTAYVKMVELSGVSAMHRSSFTSTREGGENNGAVNLQLGSKVDFSALSNVFFFFLLICLLLLLLVLLLPSPPPPPPLPLQPLLLLSRYSGSRKLANESVFPTHVFILESNPVCLNEHTLK